MRVIAMKTIDDLDRPLDDLGQIKKRDFREVFQNLVSPVRTLFSADDLILGHDLQNARGWVKRRTVNITNFLGRGQLAGRFAAHVP